MSLTRTYKSWSSMKQRCNNPKSPDFPRYGGKGVRVYQRWENSFEEFLEDMGERPLKTSLDRIDSTGDYTPENCRWADNLIQGRNKSTTIELTIGEETKPLYEWCAEYNLNPTTLRTRYKRGDRGERLLRPRRSYPKSLPAGRGELHCARGHKYSGANLVTKKDGSRLCRTCDQAAKRRWREANPQRVKSIMAKHLAKKNSKPGMGA